MPHASAQGDNHKSLTAIIKHDKLRRKFSAHFQSVIMKRTKAFEILCSD